MTVYSLTRRDVAKFPNSFFLREKKKDPGFLAPGSISFYFS